MSTKVPPAGLAPLAGSAQRAGTAQLIHASALVLGEAGVLIRGAPGAGKTSLLNMLIDAALPRGLFARLVGDDRIQLSAAGGRILMRPHPAIAGLAERRWEAIIAMAYEPAAVLRLAVDLAPEGEEAPDRLPQEADLRFVWQGISVPRLVLPATLAPDIQVSRSLAFLERIIRADFT